MAEVFIPDEEKLRVIRDWVNGQLNPLEKLRQALSPSDERMDILILMLIELNALTANAVASLSALSGVTPPGVPSLPPGEIYISRKAAEPQIVVATKAPRTVAPITCDFMADCRGAYRGVLKVESSLDQQVDCQLLGNIVNSPVGATNIGVVYTCGINDSISLGWALDLWHPYIGIRLTPLIAPAAGNITAIMQNQE